MTERSTLARPYAEAAFQYAGERKALGAWSEMLQLAAAVAGDPQMAALADNPRLPRAEFIAFYLDVCGAAQGSATRKIDAACANFLRVLHENRRLVLLPEITRLYDELRAAAEARVEAEVASAFEIGDAQLKSIAAALKKRFGLDVTLTNRIDRSLVGGMVIRAGDLVIDGSVRGQLHALATHLTR